MCKRPLRLVELESQIPLGLLRPTDTLRDLFAPPPTRNPFRWMEFQTRSGDGFLEVHFRLNQRLQAIGRLEEWGGKVYTVDELVRAWCGVPRHDP